MGRHYLSELFDSQSSVIAREPSLWAVIIYRSCLTVSRQSLQGSRHCGPSLFIGVV